MNNNLDLRVTVGQHKCLAWRQIHPEANALGSDYRWNILGDETNRKRTVDCDLEAR